MCKSFKHGSCHAVGTQYMLIEGRLICRVYLNNRVGTQPRAKREWAEIPCTEKKTKTEWQAE